MFKDFYQALREVSDCPKIFSDLPSHFETFCFAFKNGNL